MVYARFLTLLRRAWPRNLRHATWLSSSLLRIEIRVIEPGNRRKPSLPTEPSSATLSGFWISEEIWTLTWFLPGGRIGLLCLLWASFFSAEAPSKLTSSERRSPGGLIVWCRDNLSAPKSLGVILTSVSEPGRVVG